MLYNHIRFAVRHIRRSKTFTAINIAGLAVSLTAFIMMALYIENELSYDKFNTNAVNIYRVVDDKQTNALTQHTASSAAPLAPALLSDFPQVKQAVRLIDAEALVKYNNKLFEERKLYYADASIFSIFTLPMLKGNPATALAAPNNVVITQATADKYFGSEEPLGKTLYLDGQSMAVTGVIKDVPATSHISFDFLISMATAEQKTSGYNWLFTNWYSNNFYTYILLSQGYDANKLAASLYGFADKHKANSAETKHHYSLEKLTDIYLHSDRENQAGKTGSINNLYIFSAVAVFILLLACINFINLATARAAERAKEVGVKKVNGVTRAQLMLQFFTESFLMVGFALVLSVILCWLLLPMFNGFAGTQVLFVFSPLHIAWLAGIWLFTAALSGAYPALVLSSFKPVTALKGKLRTSFAGIALRKSLVVFQFTVSVILIISSIAVYTQLRYMQQANLGFTQAETMVVNFEGDNGVQTQYERIKAELLRIKGVTAVTASSKVPGKVSEGSGWSMDFAKKTGDTIHTEMPVFATDFTFLQQYGIPMAAGRALSPQFKEDTVESMLINEAAVRKLGFANAEEVLGVKVGTYPLDAKVVGVVKDFHYQSLQKAIEPLAIRVLPDKFRYFSIAISSSDIRKTVAAIEDKWKALAPQRPLEYTFLREAFNQQYQAETKFGQLFLLFTILAITIACFGLFGLALFSVKQRTKEIGVRKVVGASVAQVTLLLSKDFMVLVIIAFVIASPIALFIMGRWLQGFAYRITLSWWVFAAGGGIAALTALCTISYQAIKAAMVKPVSSLRSE